MLAHGGRVVASRRSKFRWIPTIVTVVAIVSLLFSRGHPMRNFVLIWLLTSSWALFFVPFWCLTPQHGNGRICPRWSYGLLGSCGLHRWSKLPPIFGRPRTVRRRSPAPAFATPPIPRAPRRDSYDVTMLVATVAGPILTIALVFLDR